MNILNWADKTGEFKRQVSSFRDKISEFVGGRYRLYVSLACPWAHRTLIMRKLKGLEEEIDVCVVDYLLTEGGKQIILI
jgi:glutathionyl-hydroquinone reductase